MTPERAMTARHHDDPTWAKTIEDEVSKEFSHIIGDMEFDDSFMLSMHALYRLKNPLLLLMNRNARIHMNSGRQQLYSERIESDGPQDTAPLSQHRDYDEFLPRSQPSASSRPAAKGKGKGKAKEYAAQWENLHGWSNRGYSEWDWS